MCNTKLNTRFLLLAMPGVYKLKLYTTINYSNIEL